MIQSLLDELLSYRPSMRYFLIDEVRLAQAARQSGIALPHNLAGIMAGIEGGISARESGSLGKALRGFSWVTIRSC